MLSVASDWIFRPLEYNHFHFPPTLHVGDYDMDGYPDVITVLSSSTLVLALLVVCHSKVGCGLINLLYYWPLWP